MFSSTDSLVGFSNICEVMSVQKKKKKKKKKNGRDSTCKLHGYEGFTHSLTLSQTVVQREEYEVSSCNDSTVFFLFECQKSGAFVWFFKKGKETPGTS